jgi:hypothetical protein
LRLHLDLLFRDTDNFALLDVGVCSKDNGAIGEYLSVMHYLLNDATRAMPCGSLVLALYYECKVFFRGHCECKIAYARQNCYGGIVRGLLTMG